jgi:hypothetical protein
VLAAELAAALAAAAAVMPAAEAAQSAVVTSVDFEVHQLLVAAPALPPQPHLLQHMYHSEMPPTSPTKQTQHKFNPLVMVRQHVPSRRRHTITSSVQHGRCQSAPGPGWAGGHFKVNRQQEDEGGAVERDNDDNDMVVVVVVVVVVVMMMMMMMHSFLYLQACSDGGKVGSQMNIRLPTPQGQMAVQGGDARGKHRTALLLVHPEMTQHNTTQHSTAQHSTAQHTTNQKHFVLLPPAAAVHAQELQKSVSSSSKPGDLN